MTVPPKPQHPIPPPPPPPTPRAVLAPASILVVAPLVLALVTR